MALYASCFADFVSNISLILLAGLLASFALQFGPPEFFTLIVFSLTIIAGVSADSLKKGIASAALGLLFATIGLDMVYGTNRFIFGQWQLMSGVELYPGADRIVRATGDYPLFHQACRRTGQSGNHERHGRHIFRFQIVL